jgi:hypothetical protein
MELAPDQGSTSPTAPPKADQVNQPESRARCPGRGEIPGTPGAAAWQVALPSWRPHASGLAAGPLVQPLPQRRHAPVGVAVHCALADAHRGCGLRLGQLRVVPQGDCLALLPGQSAQRCLGRGHLQVHHRPVPGARDAGWRLRRVRVRHRAVAQHRP